MPSIYLAGPEVFHAEAIALGRAKQALCAALGFEGLYPLDGEVPAGDLPAPDLGRAIYRANVGLIRRADAVIANLTPFRGPGADAGTVFEVGFALGLGKPVFGYRNVGDGYLDRVRTWNGVPLSRDGAGRPLDRDGLLVEDFGFGDNLMIDAALIEGGLPVVEHDAAPGAELTDLTAFAFCLKRAQALLAG
ncbi:nucleoside 2-deoxyribosyltransferase [Zavarzinia compransoris]|uniref:Nucleoside 2-deoxyribosyltransferase n=1 Tax=Zavarzinia compransoris TaxID=1264899 RepID=A0A317E858_9PROT|nr:nucleoside 2-deoxyribosyltransferase [Zavarzinia compransoris]PWR22436.1 nucleoside 2-deoxyribosyltransferase [Zavarzinia compransoris]TDP47129.1 nucleoside 2-deoxyribosyltransferase [Zavarzinia compransoris]